MPLTPGRRRRTDRIVAAGIAVLVVLVGAAIYLRSDIRATESVVGASAPAPPSPDAIPDALTERWRLPTNPELTPVASPYGVVVTADAATVTAHDAVTGDVRWSYGRDGAPLCAVGSGDTDAPGVTRRGKVRGVLAVSEQNGFCSQVVALDPATGERHYYRTSPNQAGGSLVFGGPYAGWLGRSLIELWRDDLVRTIQYGEQPQPPKPDTVHAGCTFTDMAIADDQFATVEHCRDSANARLVINWPTPDSAPDKPDGQDVFKHDPRADVDTGSRAARIVGITADRVAVLVSDPEPAVVVYDAAGAETSRTSVDIPDVDIIAADTLDARGHTAPTPAVPDGSARYSLIGGYLLGVDTQDVQVFAAPEETTSPTTTVPPTPGVLAGEEPATPQPPQYTTERDLRVTWVKSGARGLPAVIGDQLLVPVDDALSAFLAANGNPGIVPTTIAVDRHGYTGRVDAAAVGSMIIETRGGEVVGLG